MAQQVVIKLEEDLDGGDANETTVRFRDPGGNVIGLYQERRSTERRV